MKKFLLFALLLSITFGGGFFVGKDFGGKQASYQQTTTRSDIYDKHFAKYVILSEKTNSNNFVVSAILRELANAYITNRFVSVSNGIAYQKEFYASISTNVISSNFPVQPSSGDINVAQGLTVEILGYYWGKDRMFRNEISQVLPGIFNSFIFKINDYEFDKRGFE